MQSLVAAIGEIVREERALGDAARCAPRAERIAARLAQTGGESSENLLIALAVLATTATPLSDRDLQWIEEAAKKLGDDELLLEATGVVFAFNLINRIADARQVRLELRFLRELRPIRGWVERRLASLTGLAYDLSFKHEPRHSPAAMPERLRILFQHLGAPSVPGLFDWLSRSPVVLEGVLEMIDSNVTGARVRPDLLREAIAIGAASHAMPGSHLVAAVEAWLPREAVGDLTKLRRSKSSADSPDAALVAACRRYAWRVANAAYTITDEQIRELASLGVSDAELLDLTLATAVFSALAIIEPLSVAVPVTTPERLEAFQPVSQSAATTILPPSEIQVQVQLV